MNLEVTSCDFKIQSGYDKISSNIRQPVPGFTIPDHQSATGCGPARQVNSALVLLYWRVGRRIRQHILKEERAEYDEEIVPAVSAQLDLDFGE